MRMLIKVVIGIIILAVVFLIVHHNIQFGIMLTSG